MRALKLVGVVLGGLIALLALAAIGIWLFVDPNDYKDRIAAAVRDSTGRELELTGDIGLTIFPWVGLTLGPATLGNPPGFGTEPFAVVQKASLRVKLLPLLSSRLEIGRIEIDGLDLRLRQNAEGKGNWTFGESASETPSSGPSRPIDLAGVVIKDSRFSFDDLAAQNLNVEVGRVAPGASIPVSLKLDLVTAKGASPMPVAARFDLTMDLDHDRYQLEKLALEGTLAIDGAKAPVRWAFSSPQTALDLAAQTLASTAFEAKLASAEVGGHVAATKLIDAPVFTGDFTLQSVSPKALLPELGIDAPVTRDSKVFGSLAASGQFRYEGDEVATEALTVKLDDSSLRGRFGFDLETGGMTFDLALDAIDADRYLPPPTAPAAAPASAKSEPFELPVDVLRNLAARGNLAIGKLKVVDVHLSSVAVGIDARDGLTRIAPAQAQLYGGQYSGEVAIDTRPTAPKLTLQQSMNGLDIAQFMTDFMDVKRLSGRGNVTANVTASGRNSDALMKTLNGKVTMNLANGAVEGVDLWYAIAQAQSLIQKRTLAGGTNAGRTAFETFRSSANIVDGVATTDDLAIASQQLRVAGKGTSNLVTQAIDYQVTTTILKAPPGAEGDIAGLTLASIPVNITGTFENPKVRPDLEGLAKARLKQEVDKQKDKLEEKVRDKVEDKLRNLFKR
ncbi:MAG: AsmA family protein [Steroidobacteraceae bacterium]